MLTPTTLYDNWFKLAENSRKITHPCGNFNGGLGEVRGDVVTYPLPKIDAGLNNLC